MSILVYRYRGDENSNSETADPTVVDFDLNSTPALLGFGTHIFL
jgi:hypothetical protein